MRFGLLGSLEVREDTGALIDLGGPQPRVVVAALLVGGGQVVTSEALIDAIWGPQPPSSATGTLQSYISRLRRSLEPDRERRGAATTLVRDPQGYRLVVDPDRVDYRRFERLADEGRDALADGDPAAARALLLEAEQQWRGPALMDHRDLDFAQGLSARLEDRRLAAIGDRLAADLALGRHRAVVGELTELIAANPFQEDLRGHLALALYRSGRQAEALRSLDDARSTLRDELGVDLSRPLRELEAAILGHDRSLDLLDEARTATRAPTNGVAVPDLGDGGGPGLGSAAPEDRLIGREAELASLVAALDEAATTTRVVVVEGEPGVGKTRLVEELSAIAGRRGSTVLWGRAFEGGASPAFWPWLPPLRALAASLPPDAVLAPELAALLAPQGDGGPSTAAEPARFALFDALIAFLSERAARQPLVIVMDDLQWADVASLELLSALPGRMVDAPILLVVTVRELEVGRNDVVVDALAALTRASGSRRLALRGLTAAATAALVGQTLGEDVDPAIAEAVHARAEGNPFYVTELARLLDAGELGDDVPSGVRDVVRRRLALLPAATNTLLEVAAVIGRDVELELLTKASGGTLDECLDALDPALVHRLLVPVPDHPGTYRFAHALVREVVVDGISPLRRARLHLCVADAVEASEDTAEIVAEHLWEAVPVGVSRRAAAALEHAAHVAARRLAYASAQHLLERAVQLRHASGSEPEDLEAELTAVAMLVSVTGARDGYASLVGSPHLSRGRYLAERTGRMSELMNLLWAEWAGLDVSCRYQQADPIAAELLERAGTTDSPLAPALGHTAYGIRCWHRAAITESAHHLDEARRHSMEIPREVAGALLFDLDQIRISAPFSVYLHDLVGDLDDPEREFDEVVAWIPGDSYWELLVMNFAASGALSTGDLDRAIRSANRGISVDPEGMSAFWSTAQRAYLGAALALQGHLDDGIAQLDAAWRDYTAIGLRTNGVTLLASRGQALAQAGRLDEAAASLSDARQELADYQEEYAHPTLLLAEAVLEHARGEGPEVVRTTLRRGADLAVAHGSHAIAARVHRTAEELGVEVR